MNTHITTFRAMMPTTLLSTTLWVCAAEVNELFHGDDATRKTHLITAGSSGVL
jgi:hypothetical protein